MSSGKNYFGCVESYLKKHSLNELRKKHGVRHAIHGHLVGLAYDQFEASKTNRIASNCRGAVIARKDGSSNICPNMPFGELEIVAFPFMRFFNYGEDPAAYKRFNLISVQEKYDGTCIVFYYDPFLNKWQVGTRNNPIGNNESNSFDFSENNTESFKLTFRELFEKTLNDSYGCSSIEEFGSRLNKRFTYIFELMTPQNLVVVTHKEYKLALIGARNLDTQEEINVELDDLGIKDLGIILPKNLIGEIGSDNIDDIIKFVESRPEREHEGVVLLGENYQRIKIKNSRYTKVSRIQDINFSDIVSHIVNGDIDDIYAIAPEIGKKKIDFVEKKFSSWVKRQNDVLSSIEWDFSLDKKEFVQNIFERKDIDKVLRAMIFKAFDNKVPLKEVQDMIGKYGPKVIWSWIRD